jgi:hypothetical protein
MSVSLQRCVARSLTVGAVAGFASLALAQSAPPNPTPDATLRSTPENVIWGYITADLPPVLTIKSGQTVRIDTVSHHGLLTRDDPVAYFGKAGIRADEVLQDAIDIYQKGVRARGSSVHVLTGPIYIEEAAPGDMLEVRVHKLEHRVPYGVNSGGPRSGVLPDLLSAPALKIIKFDLARNVALFSPEIEIPLAPFLGIMSVAPSRDVLLVALGRQHRLQQAHPRLVALSAGVQQRRPVLHRRSACGAGRWRGERQRHRSVVDRDAAIHRPQGRRQGHALAARRGRGALLPDGDGSRS